MSGKQIDPALLNQYTTQKNQTLAALLETGPVLLVFLRHFG